jgi:hypothetical protein
LLSTSTSRLENRYVVTSVVFAPYINHVSEPSNAVGARTGGYPRKTDF